jgi:hypothetical protein
MPKPRNFLRPFYLSSTKREILGDLLEFEILVDRSFLKGLMIPKIFGAGKDTLLTHQIVPFLRNANARFPQTFFYGCPFSKETVYGEFLYHNFAKVLEDVTSIGDWQSLLLEVHDLFFESVLQAGCNFNVYEKDCPVFHVLLPDGSIFS